MSVAVGGFHFENSITNLQHGDIEGAPAQIINGDLFVLLLVQTVGQGGGGWFIDDPQHLQPRNPTRILGGLPLGIVEVGRHRDHRLTDRLTKTHLSVRFELGENHRRNLGRTKLLGLSVDLNLHRSIPVGSLDDPIRNPFLLFVDFVKLPTHKPLHGIDRVSRIRDRLPFGSVTHKSLTGFGECHNGRRRAFAFRVFQHERLPTFHDAHAGVRCS